MSIAAPSPNDNPPESAFLLEIHVGDVRQAAPRHNRSQTAPLFLMHRHSMRARATDISLYVLPWRMQAPLPPPPSHAAITPRSPFTWALPQRDRWMTREIVRGKSAPRRSTVSAVVSTTLGVGLVRPASLPTARNCNIIRRSRPQHRVQSHSS